MLIPMPILIIGFLIAWLGLAMSWRTRIESVTEARRLAALSRGERPPDIRGVSNYERAELMEAAHRRMLRTKAESFWTLFILAGIPLLTIAIYLLRR